MVRENTHGFVVRIWHEAVARDGRVVTWRGSIEHVGSGERLHFDDMADLIDFIQERSGLKRHSTFAWWRSVFDWIRL